MKKHTRVLASIGILVVIALTFNHHVNYTISEDKLPLTFNIEPGESVASITSRLEREGLVSSSFLARLYLSWWRNDTKVGLGVFEFDIPLTTSEVLRKLTSGSPSKPLVKVTIPEGSTDAEVVAFIRRAVPSLSESELYGAIESYKASGFLFPETYFLTGLETAEAVVLRMRSTFAARYNATFGTQFSGESIVDDHDSRLNVSMAAILEGEANNEYDMKLVAGILHNRLRIKMPLQVDVDRSTYETLGLPNPPIANPGLIALKAAQMPISTTYLYYITGRDGKMYYAKTFEEHKRNIAKHLK